MTQRLCEYITKVGQLLNNGRFKIAYWIAIGKCSAIGLLPNAYIFIYRTHFTLSRYWHKTHEDDIANYCRYRVMSHRGDMIWQNVRTYKFYRRKNYLLISSTDHQWHRLSVAIFCMAMISGQYRQRPQNIWTGHFLEAISVLMHVGRGTHADFAMWTSFL